VETLTYVWASPSHSYQVRVNAIGTLATRQGPTSVRGVDCRLRGNEVGEGTRARGPNAVPFERTRYEAGRLYRLDR
jgi:hypothetical protein